MRVENSVGESAYRVGNVVEVEYTSQMMTWLTDLTYKKISGRIGVT